jgi:hypothetical protein
MTCQIHKKEDVKVQASTGSTRSDRFLEASSESATAPVFPQKETLSETPKRSQPPQQQNLEVEKLQQMHLLQGLHDIEHLQDHPT